MTETTIVPLELRYATATDDPDSHAVEGLCVPYNRVTLKAGAPRGERFIPGAFAGLDRNRIPKIRLTDSHDASGRRPIGVATSLTETRDGLHGVFRFYDTPEGRGGWENVREGTYGGLSVGFVPVAERTAADGVREITKAQLWHVSLVDEPAYDEARVLALRSAMPDVSALLDAPPLTADDFPDVPDITGLVWGPDGVASRGVRP